MLAGHGMLHSGCGWGLQLLLPSSYPAFPLRSKTFSSTPQLVESLCQRESPGTSFGSLQAATRTAPAQSSWRRESLQTVGSYRLRFDWMLTEFESRSRSTSRLHRTDISAPANTTDATSAIRFRAGRVFPAFAAILIPASVLSKKSARLSRSV